MPAGKKARGWLLRLALQRPTAFAAGAALAAPAVWLALTDQPWENAATDGLGLVCGATGIALLLSALGGRRPDWIDPDDQ